MVMSAVEVRTHGINITSHEKATITPSRSAENSVISPTYSSPRADVPSAYSVSSMLLAQGQQDATSMQIASKTLHIVGRELGQMKLMLSESMTKGISAVPGLQEQVMKGKVRIDAILDQARFNGMPVLDNELDINISNRDMRRFSIPGLNVTRMQDKPEQIRLDFPQGQSVMLHFDGKLDPKKTIQVLDRTLIPMGMRAQLSQDGSILFETSSDNYRHMQQKVMITGQGHRFPAGQANAFSLKPEPEGISELRFDLSHREGIKQGLTKINGYLLKTQASLEKAKDFQQQLTAHMQQLKQMQPSLSVSDANQKLSDFQQMSGQFTNTFKALNAQANVKRHSVVALLKQ